MIFSFCAFIDKQKRVDIFLSALFWEFSRSRIQKIIDNWDVKINWKTVSKNIKIKNKDLFNINIINKEYKIKAEKIKIEIINEDENILIINKDSWINVHPVPWENWESWTLVNAILYHCKNSLPTIGWEERPWIVHRLDKDTSWVIMIAKNDKMMNYLSEIIKNRKIEKYYIAIVDWIIKEEKIKIESNIWRDENDRKKMSIKSQINPKYALTYAYKLGYIKNKYTLLKVKIETWRTHQIRVHLSSIWFPIIWDKVYWNEKINKEAENSYWLKRQALHAFCLKLNLYWKEKIFIWKLKDDMKKVIWDSVDISKLDLFI